MSSLVSQHALQIWQAIQKSQRILMHLHPNPDGDCTGAALAMVHALQPLQKKITLIQGDSQLPLGLKILPGTDHIQAKSYAEISLTDYDLFIILDSSSLGQITRRATISFPETLTTIVIDHHATNAGFGQINLVDSSYPATCQILFDLFKEWGITFTPDIAACLFTGIYTDTGGFKYRGATPATFQAAGELTQLYPDFPQLIFHLFNSNEPQYIYYLALALSSVELHCGGKVALSAVTLEQLDQQNIQPYHTGLAEIGNYLISVTGWMIGVKMVEHTPGEFRVSFRTRDAEQYDVSRLAMAIGGKGGGHKAAAGTNIRGNLTEAKQELLRGIAEIFPELAEK